MQDLRALVVDDSKVGRLTMQRKLEAMGIRVELAESGAQALDLLARQPPDLVFMDHMMPDMDGFEVTRRIKASPALRDIPVIIVSGNDEASFVEEARQAGALGAMTKPPATEALESLLASLPARAESAAAMAAPSEPRVDVGALAEGVVAALREEVDQRLVRQATMLDELNRRLADLAARTEPDLTPIQADLEQRLAAGLAGLQANIDSQSSARAALRETLQASLDAQIREIKAESASLRQALASVSEEVGRLDAELRATCSRLDESSLRRFVAETLRENGPAPTPQDAGEVRRDELDRLRAGFRRLAALTLLGGALLLAGTLFVLLK